MVTPAHTGSPDLFDLFRHLPGRHDQSSHGRRFSVPGDPESGLKKAAEAGDSAAPDALKPEGREFTARELRDILVEHGHAGRSVDEHRQLLEKAGATPGQSEAILKDLGADTDQGWLHKDLSSTLHTRALKEGEAEKRAEHATQMRELTPTAYASLLGDGPTAITHRPTRKVFEAAQARRWVIESIQPGSSVWVSADGTRRIRMNTGPGNPVLYDANTNNKLSYKRALELVVGEPARRANVVSVGRSAMPYGGVKYADPGYQPDGQRRYPIDTPDHVRAAWSYVNQEENASRYTPQQLMVVKGRIRRALRRIGAEQAPEPARSHLATGLRGLLLARSGPLTYHRSYALDDIQISRSEDGRTVEAYAAIFDTPYEVRDQHGHYLERIDRSAFNRTLNGAGRNAICVYNHGMTIHGTPDGMASLPLGKPLEIKPDGRGLMTVTRYNKGPWADSVLESIKNGEIKAQSFRGQIFRSSPMGPVPRRQPGRPLTTVTRHELGLADYGPTPTAVNDDAAIVAVRSAADIIDAIGYLDADEREELVRHLGLDDSTPVPEEDEDPEDLEDEEDDLEDEDVEEAGEEPQDDVPTPDQTSGPGAEDPPAERSTARHSGRLEIDRALLRMELIRRGARRGKAA